MILTGVNGETSRLRSESLAIREPERYRLFTTVTITRRGAVKADNTREGRPTSMFAPKTLRKEAGEVLGTLENSDRQLSARNEKPSELMFKTSKGYRS